MNIDLEQDDEKLLNAALLARLSAVAKGGASSRPGRSDPESPDREIDADFPDDDETSRRRGDQKGGDLS